jgi:hypothetical protein
MMLIDKGFYDYDFERVKEKVKQIFFEDTVKTDEEARNVLAGFGFGIKASSNKSLDELQEMAMKQFENK